MSGYLQRLVQTASQPVQSVHPFAGSIFASSHGNRESSVETEGFVVATPPINRPTGPTLQPQTFTHRNAQPEIVPLREYRPIAPVGIAPLLQTESETNALPFQEEQFAHRPRPSASQEESKVERVSPHLTPQSEFHPLMPQQPFVAEPDLSQAPYKAKTLASGDNRRSVAADRTNNDIQIHIGRIEVTAVHPPAPRAAKTPDRGPSLDAYLNRRAR
jgi:hypothetical protein